MKRAWAILLVLLSALTQTACGTTTKFLTDVAGDKFSVERSCPKAGLSIKQVSFEPQDLFSPRPPADVALDPARLAVWKLNKSVQIASYQNLIAVDVTGCGLHSTYFCYRTDDGRGHNNNYLCSVVNLTDPDAKGVGFIIDPSMGRSIRERLDAIRP